MFWAIFMCFSSYLCLGRVGGGQTGLVHNLLMQFLSLYSSKIEVSKTSYFDFDHPRYVKHLLARICVVFTLVWVCVAWGRLSARWFAEGNRISETDFFVILTIQNDEISYVKHVLAPFYVFFTLFGCWGPGGGGGVPTGLGHNLLLQFSSLGSSKTGNFRN